MHRTTTELSPLARIRHVLLDLDGTLYRGDRLLPATLPFLDRLRRLGVGRTFITNNTSRSKADYVAKLGRLGIAAAEADIYTPADSVIAYLRDYLPCSGSRHTSDALGSLATSATEPDVTKIAVLGTPSLVAQFERAGFAVSWEDPGAVVVGFDTTLPYDRLCRAAYWVREGKPFLATHPDLVCPTDEPTVLVDCGSICACLTAATGRRPLVFGKPDPSLVRELSGRLGLEPAELAVVGDRVYTDVALAQNAGALAVLVLTGEATAADAAALDVPPDLVVADVGEFGERLEQARRAAGNDEAAP